MSKVRSDLHEAISQYLIDKYGAEHDFSTIDFDRVCAYVEESIDEAVLEQSPKKSEYGKMAERMDMRYDSQY